jgi:hypothetical protein
MKPGFGIRDWGLETASAMHAASLLTNPEFPIPNPALGARP